MRPRGASIQRHGLSWVILLALTASALDGMLRGGRPDDGQTMQCCRKEGYRWSQDTAENCCRPNRCADNPATPSAAGGSAGKTERNDALAGLPFAAVAPSDDSFKAPTLRARGLPVPFNESRSLPLLI
jgi:hypothetical protein